MIITKQVKKCILDERTKRPEREVWYMCRQVCCKSCDNKTSDCEDFHLYLKSNRCDIIDKSIECVREFEKSINTITLHEIEYDGKKYNIRQALLRGEEILVGTEDLEMNLLNEDTNACKDKDAEQIDDEIYCYVPSRCMNLPEDRWNRYINSIF